MSGNMITQDKRQMSLPEVVLSEITARNSDVDNASLMNKVNMILAKVPKMSSMPPEQIAQAVLKAMIPDPSLENHDDIYFIPYGRTIDVSFSHNFLQKLAYKNGAVKLIETFVIYENDNVEVSEEGVTYKINPFKKNRGDFVGIMVKVKLANNELKYGFVDVDHIEKARKASKSGNNGPWKTWYLEMAKKVAIKNTLKGIDISPEFNAAVNIDNEDTDFRKLSTDIEPTEAQNSLADKMKTGSKSVIEVEKYLKENGVVFDIKDKWVIVNLLESEVGTEELMSKFDGKKNPDNETVIAYQIEKIMAAI